MRIIAFGDIHEHIEHITTIEKISEASLVIITGDLTNVGGIKKAKKVIILHEDPVLIQDIMSYVTGSDLQVIILTQFAPPFVKYLAGQKPGQIFIVNNLFQIVRELYEKMNLPLSKPPVISIPVPPKLGTRSLTEIKIPKVILLKIIREDYKKKLLPLNSPIQEKDRILIYLEDYQESLKNLVDFLSNL